MRRQRLHIRSKDSRATGRQESPPACLRSCPHCGHPLPARVFRWEAVRRLMVAFPRPDQEAERLAVMKVLFPHDGLPPVPKRYWRER